MRNKYHRYGIKDMRIINIAEVIWGGYTKVRMKSLPRPVFICISFGEICKI